MKFCLVADSLDIGGAERHVVDLARGIGRRGHAVTIACSQAGPLAGELGDTDISVVPLLGRRIKRRVSLVYATRLHQHMRGHRFDLVHAHMYASQAAAALASIGTALPLVLTEHSEGSWQQRRHREVSRWYVTRADHVIAVSDGIHRRLVERLGVDPECVTIIPNAAAPPQHVNDIPGAGLGNGADGAFLVGVVGRLCPEKGHLVFLEAVARIAASVPGARFLIIGDGPLMPFLQARTRSLALDGWVSFLGERADARAIIAGLDLLVVPSYSEGSPLVILEALSSGVPVLASHVGGIPDQVTTGENGILVPPGDPGALAAALANVLLRPGLRYRLREGARSPSPERSHESMVDRVEAVYRAVLAHGHRAAHRSLVPARDRRRERAYSDCGNE